MGTRGREASCVKLRRQGLSLELQRVMEDPLTLIERRGRRELHGATKIRAWEQRAHDISRGEQRWGSYPHDTHAARRQQMRTLAIQPRAVG